MFVHDKHLLQTSSSYTGWAQVATPWPNSIMGLRQNSWVRFPKRRALEGSDGAGCRSDLSPPSLLVRAAERGDASCPALRYGWVCLTNHPPRAGPDASANYP